MELSPAIVWTCLLGLGLVLGALTQAVSTTSSRVIDPRPPRLTGCVFLNRANVTCRWEAGDTPTTHYTLQVERLSGRRRPDPLRPKSPYDTFTCDTPQTSCTAFTGSSVRFTFCVSVVAHGPGLEISSQPRCQSGREEVMLPPVTLDSVQPVVGRPQCLNVTWSRTLAVFPVSDSETRAGNLKSQVEFAAQDKPDVQVRNVTVTDYSFVDCDFRPDTSYTIRLRHQYRGPKSPWSPWSNAHQGTTGEDAPSLAPAFWRRVKQTDKDGRRLTSLLWKPLPRSLANGRVLFYNVTCRAEGVKVLGDHGTCTDLLHQDTSCVLLLPAAPCSCSLTASNSGGMSPEARVWLLGASETEPSPPIQIIANPLNDSSVDVRWTSPTDRPTSGFVVEWFAVREKSRIVLYWEMLSNDSRALVITEGVKPMERYVVSVKALYGERGAGPNRTVQMYTRQGTPSAGPRVEVQELSGSTVELTWSPVPVEELQGFIRNYTLCYKADDQPVRRLLVSGHAHRHRLGNLLPGNYDIFMQANTDAGAGAAGPVTTVHIGPEEVPIGIYASLPLIVTSLALMLMACLLKNKMVKQKLCQDVPDPSHSSLAHWMPKTTLERVKWPRTPEKTQIKYSEVILLGDSVLWNSAGSDQLSYIKYQSASQLQASYCDRYSLLPTSASQTPLDALKPERRHSEASTCPEAAPGTDLSSLYSNVLLSHTPKSLPAAPFSHPSVLKSDDCQPSPPCVTAGVNDAWPQLGGDSGPYVSLQQPYFQTDELKTISRCLNQRQSPIPFSDYCRLSHLSSFCSFSDQAEVKPS